MTQAPNHLHETASQTAGPYVHIGLAPGAAGFDVRGTALGQDIAGPNAAGERIKIAGTIWDGSDAPVTDALIEVWQANAAGIYAHPDHPGMVEDGFRGWGRVVPDFETGLWDFETIKPGAVSGQSGTAIAPHINLWIVARGMNVGLHTRLYFPQDLEAHATDPVLAMMIQDSRRDTLIAKPDGKGTYRFDIRLQGDDETVFFDV